ncbi:protein DETOXIFICATION 48-like [Iris pallida]|uniref:Protein DETOXIFICATION 48-like n=1 Tax=Iris pallida TaxID=29817 RepID=A0AAX6E952_IRIPA|nr:protein DETOXIFICATION 48-like [Iris pallida]
MGMEPICGQAFGAKQRKLLGLTLQRTILLLLSASVPISFLWLNMDGILRWSGQDRDISSAAQLFITVSIPDLIFLSFLHPIRIYLRTQNITLPVTYCSVVSVVLTSPSTTSSSSASRWASPGWRWPWCGPTSTSSCCCVLLALLGRLQGLLGQPERRLPPGVVRPAEARRPDLRIGVLGVVVVRVHDNAVRAACQSEGHRRVHGDPHPDDLAGLRLPPPR